MASTMNSGGSIDLNRNGEKLSFNVDIHVEAATFIHARAFMHFIQWDEM